MSEALESLQIVRENEQSEWVLPLLHHKQHFFFILIARCQYNIVPSS